MLNTDKRVAYEIHYYDAINSTSDTLREMALAGAPPGTAVTCNVQLKGRGRRGNTWISPEGNVYLSVLLREDIPLKDAGQISFLAAVALGEAVEPWLTKEWTVRQKWPNDVWLNDRKLAGILLESEGEANNDRMKWLILGTGINIGIAPDTAVKLNDVYGTDIDLDKVRHAYLERLFHWLKVWRRDGFSPVRAAWMQNARGLDREIIVRLSHTEKTGIFRGIDESGCLMLEQSGKIEKHASGDVFFF